MKDGYFGVGAHGNRNSVFDAEGNKISPKELAKMILNHENYVKGDIVVLGSCKTGLGTRCYAKKLADELAKQSKEEATVLAPTTNAMYYAKSSKKKKRLKARKPGKFKKITSNKKL